MFKVRGTLQASSRNRVHFEASPGLQWFIHSLVLWSRDTYLTSLSLSFLISKIEVNVCHLSGDRGSVRTCAQARTLAAWLPASCRIPDPSGAGLQSRDCAPGSACRLSLQGQLLGTASSHSSGTTSLALLGPFHGWLFGSHDLLWASHLVCGVSTAGQAGGSYSETRDEDGSRWLRDGSFWVPSV